MTTTKLISVFGASGQQGGGVVEALLKNSNFKVRALTRNPDSESSKKLKEQGVEVVRCDDSDSKEMIQDALAGSYGVFCVTNYWAYFEKEVQYGRNMADAALAAGVKHFVFSSLTPMNKISEGRISVPHYDQKYEIEEYVRELSKLNSNTFISSFVYAPGYMQNFLTFYPPKKNDQDGTFTLTTPSDPNGKPLDIGDISEMGYIVEGILMDPIKYSGAVIPISGDCLTGPQIAEIYTKVTGKTVNFNFIPPSVFRNLKFIHNSDAIASMYEFCNQYGAFGNIDKSIAPKIHKLKSFEEFLIKNNVKLE
ncbi:hypothetical protein RB653_002254 [Dictyostelium firmibasis]|uniref:NmrA-like family domain-containing protein 1 n=1 Tax=Dictyostelium firmibasis TaxID=79012 RepID=A0AAN7TXG5_9MYCE